MIYTYEILSGPDVGTLVEVEHKMTEPAYDHLMHKDELCQVRRVITGGTGFILKGDCWAKNNYERGMQTPPKPGETEALLKSKRGY